MRKLVKAAAALTAGCMLLSTSAFAMTSNLSVDGENLLTDGAITVNITGLNAGQSTIMVLKGDAALEDASEANIVYINQADIVDGAASYNVNLGAAFEGTATVYAGGTAETATKLGVLSVKADEPDVPVVPDEPEVPEYTLGDVHADGVINISDVTDVLNAYLGNINLDDTQKLAADVSPKGAPDGIINISDVTDILNAYLGNATLQ